jgi:hypothetical protein
MAFPSTISTFTQVSASDRLNSPSHSALHNDVSSVLTQVQTVIGTDASTLGTILGDLRNPSSNGGGHVQTANKGGTGQTAYTKGDLLVATSTSVLTKLAVGTDGQVLQASSVAAAGVAWGTAPPRAKVAISGSVMTYVGSVGVAQSVMSVTIPGSTLGTNNAVAAKVFTEMINNNQTTGFRWDVHYGASLIASQSVPIPGGNSTTSVRGTLEVTLIGANSPSAQLANVSNIWQQVGSSVLGSAPTYATLAVDSALNRTLDISVAITNSATNASVITRGYIVEKLD